MGKALITNRIYLEGLTKTQYDAIVDTLTYKLPKAFNPNANKYNRSIPVEVIRNYKLLPKGILAIPQTREDLIPEGFEIIDRRIDTQVEFPEPIYDLYDNQKVIYDQVDGNCIINAVPGWGKTFTGLHIAKKLGRKTLIIVHTLFLRDQWIDSIRNLLGIEPGIISSGKVDYDSPITVSNIQTLSKHLTKLHKEFGLVINDECLDYESIIDTLEFGKKKLGVIVNQKLDCHVLSLNVDTNKVEYKKVKNYYKNKEKYCLKLKFDSGGSIKCTGNHNVYTWDNGIINKVQAENINIGTYVIENKLKHKGNNILNKEWYPIILGLILGDGSLQLDNEKSNSCRLRVTHGEGQKDYLDWKSGILKDTTITTGRSGYNKNRQIFTITTKSFIDTNKWKEDLYLNSTGSKVKVPKHIAELLTIESWALIYQDDGSSSDEFTCVFSVCELDLESIGYLTESLKTLFKIETPKIFTCNKGFNYIRLNKSDSLLFKSKIKNLVHPILTYKLKGIDLTDYKFNFRIPEVPMFNTEFSVRKVVEVSDAELTNGYRYNIEVEDNHNYFANSILVSNCHHCPASTFTSTINSFHSKFKIGLSATLQRKDNKQVLFRDAFGSKVLVAKSENIMKPSVQIIESNFYTDATLGWGDRVTKLCNDLNYRKFIVDIAKVYKDKGHSLLILGDRTEFLYAVGELLGDEAIVITGQTKDREGIVKDIMSGKYKYTVASTKIFAEGISVNILSALILTGPINNDSLLEQIIGRIQRNFDGKLDPVIIDINFCGYADRAQNESRLGFYMRKGWDIQTA